MFDQDELRHQFSLEELSVALCRTKEGLVGQPVTQLWLQFRGAVGNASCSAEVGQQDEVDGS